MEINTNLVNSKEKLIDSIHSLGSILKENAWVYLADYIENNIALPELEDDFEYHLKWNIDVEEIYKAKIFWNAELKCWKYTEVEKVCEIPLFVSIEKAAELKKQTPSYIRRLCREGKINAKKIANDWLVNAWYL